MTHYIIVLRGLTLGQTAAQVAHAAGESFYLYSGVAQLSERREARKGGAEVEGGNPSSGANSDAIDRTTAVILGARNAHRLERLARTLTAAGIPHVVIREPDAPFNGCATAVGLVPGDREKLSAYVRDFHLLPDDAAESAA